MKARKVKHNTPFCSYDDEDFDIYVSSRLRSMFYVTTKGDNPKTVCTFYYWGHNAAELKELFRQNIDKAYRVFIFEPEANQNAAFIESLLETREIEVQLTLETNRP